MVTILDICLSFDVGVAGVSLAIEQRLHGLLILILRLFFEILIRKLAHPRISVVYCNVLDLLILVLPNAAVEQIQRFILDIAVE